MNEVILRRAENLAGVPGADWTVFFTGGGGRVASRDRAFGGAYGDGVSPAVFVAAERRQALDHRRGEHLGSAVTDLHAF